MDLSLYKNESQIEKKQTADGDGSRSPLQSGTKRKGDVGGRSIIIPKSTSAKKIGRRGRPPAAASAAKRKLSNTTKKRSNNTDDEDDDEDDDYRPNVKVASTNSAATSPNTKTGTKSAKRPNPTAAAAVEPKVYIESVKV